MVRLINISSPQQQLRENRNLLLTIGGISSVAGLLVWSSSPFIFSSTKDKINIFCRYLSLAASLGCGITTLVCGHRLSRIDPLIQAINQAEKQDFLTQLAASQYQQEQQWNQMAIAPTQLQPLSNIQPQHSEPITDSHSTTSTDSLPTSQNSEVTGSEHFRSLYKSVSLLKEQGLSDTKLVEEVLGMGGRKFNEGKQMLDALIQLGEKENW